VDEAAELSRARVCRRDLLDEREARAAARARLRSQGSPRLGIGEINNPKLTSLRGSMWLISDTDDLSRSCLIDTPGQPKQAQLFTARATNREPVLHGASVGAGRRAERPGRASGPAAWGRISVVANPQTVFDKTMRRVDGLLLLHPELHGVAGRPKQHVSDLLRGALVLSVAALDALVLDSVVAAIPRAVRDGRLGPNVAKWVKEEPEAFLALLPATNSGAKLAELCREKLGAITFQRAAMIEGVMRDVVQKGPPWPRAADILSRGGPTWTADEVKETLDEIVERRHRIAHSGDMLPKKTATRPIQLSYVQDAVIVIEAVGQAVTQTLR
jgi:hypothetical protein